MAKRVSVGEFLLAVEGLALTRRLFDGTNEHTETRLREIAEIVDRSAVADSTESMAITSHCLDPLSAYAAWAESYDGVPNALIDVEQPALTAVLDSLPAGSAIDVCCGTGRVARLLAERGFDTAGADQSPEMLAVAISGLPETSFQCCPLDQVSGHYDVVTCALALTHFTSLAAPVRCLANLAKPGGHVVISDVHPIYTALGNHAFFNADDGSAPFVRNEFHLIGDYLRAFADAGLDVIDCIEPVPTDGEGPMRSLVGLLRPDAARSAYTGLPVAIVWKLRKR